jgi:hypothetical protein
MTQPSSELARPTSELTQLSYRIARLDGELTQRDRSLDLGGFQLDFSQLESGCELLNQRLALCCWE